jgi:hypothetical protein
VGVDTVHSNSKFRANNISKTRFGKVQKCTFFSSYVQRYPKTRPGLGNPFRPKIKLQVETTNMEATEVTCVPQSLRALL